VLLERLDVGYISPDGASGVCRGGIRVMDGPGSLHRRFASTTSIRRLWILVALFLEEIGVLFGRVVVSSRVALTPGGFLW
jgi:hypothetical protein